MKVSEKITVYSDENSSPSIVKSFQESFKNLPQAHELGFRLFKRNLKAKYRQSFLGFFWELVPPLMTAAIWILLRSNSVTDFGDTGVPYAVFVLTGTLLWQLFAESLNAPLESFNSNISILVKINVPREGLLLSGIYTLIFHLIIKLGLLTIMFIYFDQPISSSLLLVPLGIISIIICGYSIGLLLIPIGMLYTDIKKLTDIGLPFLMYLTPVIYPPKDDGIVGFILKINPMATLLTETRNWFTSQPSPDTSSFIILTIGFSILLFLGIIIFKISMPVIIERIGS